jgi:zinc protease
MTERTAPTTGQPPRLTAPRIQTHKLANGLTVACVEQRHLPIVDIELVVRAGAVFDEPRFAGRAMMAAEMLDEGTATRSVMQIAEEVDYLGAHLSTSAGWDTTLIALHVLSSRLHEAFDVMAEIVLAPTFPVEEFGRKKRERLTTILQDRDEPRVLANKALARGVFGVEHAYGQPTGGTYASISALTLDDVKAFYEAQYHPENAYVVVVGDIAFAEAVRLIEDKLGGWRNGRASEAIFVEPVMQATNRLLLVDKPRSAQAEIRVGHVGPSRRTADYFPLVVMNTMLGGSFTSRLNLKLREEMGVTYGASSKFGWRTRSGLFWAGAAVDSEAAAASVAVVFEEMRRMREEVTDAVEMERAAQYIAYGLPRAFETTEDIAAHVREQLLHGFSDDYWSKYVEEVLAVTPAQVREVAVRHLQPDRATAVVVADRETVEAELQQLGLGEVIIADVEA